jgi:hypothetical protein
MLKGRRVGTFTAGISLVTFGVLFFLRTVSVGLDYQVILRLWPIILILLGIEIIVAYIVNRDEKIRYDAGAIVLVMILSVFAMCMGGTEFIFEHSVFHNGYWTLNGIRK